MEKRNSYAVPESLPDTVLLFKCHCCHCKSRIGVTAATNGATTAGGGAAGLRAHLGCIISLYQSRIWGELEAKKKKCKIQLLSL